MFQIDTGVAISIFGLSFGAWAFVVKSEMNKIRQDFEHMRGGLTELKDALKEVASTLIDHVNHTERRLTMLETEFNFLRRYLTEDHNVSHK